MNIAAPLSGSDLQVQRPGVRKILVQGGWYQGAMPTLKQAKQRVRRQHFLPAGEVPNVGAVCGPKDQGSDGLWRLLALSPTWAA